MKKFNLGEAQQQKKEAEEAALVKPQPCHVCSKMLKGSYGKTTLKVGLIWSCSAVCEREVQKLKQGEIHDSVPRIAEAQAQ